LTGSNFATSAAQWERANSGPKPVPPSNGLTYRKEEMWQRFERLEAERERLRAVA
jgi:hypothetical protein